MTLAGPNDLLRAGLLEGVSLLVAGEPSTVGAGRAVAEVCASLGAHVVQCEVDAADEATIDDAVAGAVGEMGGIDLLVVDGAALFAHGLARGGGGPAGVEGPAGADARAGAEGHAGGDGHAALRACMDGSWNATRAVVNNAFLQAPEPRGRVVFLAPAPDAGEYAAAAAAGLENLARTLSIEWARYAITTVTVAPGVDTAAGEVATLVAYLASPAGAYFSGCLLDLRGAAAG
jgi:NAD(P)-dependent dehydrogenase (short-subunit alcohol dehydrogenase family)